MRFSQFIDVFVAALYNETQLTGQNWFRMSDVLGKYGLTLNPTWRESMFSDHDFSSHVAIRRHIGPAEDQRVSLSPDGVRWVEDQLGENVAIFLEQNGVTYEGSEVQTGHFDAESFDPEAFDTGLVPENALTTEDGTPIVTEDGDYIVTEEASEASEVPSFASADWTGITERLGPEQRARIGELSGALLAAVKQSDLDERSKITASKHIEAVQTLLEAPDPPWKAIVELLNQPALIAFLTAVDILRLIWGAAS